MRARLAALGLACAVQPAAAQDLNLVYFSTEPDFAGAGWTHAPLGLGASGPIGSLELGGTFDGTPVISLTLGWRMVAGRLVATLTGGAEITGDITPLGSLDLWWDRDALMAAGSFEATPDYVDWRVATGWRPQEGWPWIGPEVSAADGPARFGLHATNIPLPFGAEGRASVAFSDIETYWELSLWRRF
ncbi:hypothetical protein [Breoghania sp. L-A4]|uniref:hypothetical protein n=1 Tax=Breoghania sp. L-A4 TaxID=2304600 RepID=UPI0013C2A1DD|nr:hypothetical protein [Breoghania sp. L-A4]